jgi:hypothetical protein
MPGSRQRRIIADHQDLAVFDSDATKKFCLVVYNSRVSYNQIRFH